MKTTENEKMKVAIILEAAGDARRFGRNKLLEPLGNGRLMISNILEAVRSVEKTYISPTGISSDTVVCSFSKILVTQYDDVADLAPDFTIVKNDHPEIGISHSMQLGIAAAEDVDAYMFCVCDQPFITADTITSLTDAYLEASSSGKRVIVSLSWQGRMYNPKIFSSDYRDELMALSGDTGGRQIISSHLDELLLVEAGSEKEIRDIDTPEEVPAHL